MSYQPAWQEASHPKLIYELANVPKPIKWFSKFGHRGKARLLLARPLSPVAVVGRGGRSPWGQLRQRQRKWQMGWGPLGKKGRVWGVGCEVACGSVIECRSGLSWWGGGDDKVEWKAGVSGKDYKAFGSPVPPLYGWPQALHITCFHRFFSCCCC